MKTLTKENNIRKFSLFIFIISQFLIISLFGCQDTFDPITLKNQQPGKGSFSLMINRAQTGRTILPTTNIDNFIVFDLEFYNYDTYIPLPTISRTNDDLSYIIPLDEGTYKLTVTAYMDEDKTLPAATGFLERIEIFYNKETSGSVELKAIDDDGIGTFRWEIDFPEDIVNGYMEIIPLNNSYEPKLVNLLTDAFDSDESGFKNNNGFQELNTGIYQVYFKLEKKDDVYNQLRAEHREILHIYKNMDSSFDFKFQNSYFHKLITVKFNINYSNNNSPVPENKTVREGFAYGELPTISREKYTFDGWYTTNEDERIEVTADTTVTIPDEHELYAQWVLKVSNEEEWKNAVNFINGEENDNEFIISVSGNIDITPEKENTFTRYIAVRITVTIKGDNLSNTRNSLSLKENGSLLIIGGGYQTLILENISLKGWNSNNSPLVIVNKNSYFFMKNYSSVSSNNIINNNGYGQGNGGGVYVNGGTFIMESGSSVYGNTAYGSGGGVYVGANGTFQKTGGIIYGSNNQDSSLKNSANKGHAVYVDVNGDENNSKIRNTTADDSINLNSGNSYNWE